MHEKCFKLLLRNSTTQFQGLYISGVLGDRIDPRIVLSIGMWGAGIIVITC